MRIMPSLASADWMRMGETLDELKDWPFLHADLEDGNFTPNMTFGLRLLGQVMRRAPQRQVDAHLMVTNPLDYLQPLQAMGIGSVCTHMEALRFPLLFLNGARQRGMKAGLALNLQTPVALVEPFLPSMDYLLVMTAEPDAQGEKLNEGALQKACAAAQTLPIPVYADGALDETALKRLAAAGVLGCVLGRLVFSHASPLSRLRQLDDLVSQSYGKE